MMKIYSIIIETNLALFGDVFLGLWLCKVCFNLTFVLTFVLTVFTRFV